MGFLQKIIEVNPEKLVRQTQIIMSSCTVVVVVEPASVAQLDVRPTGDQKVVGLTPAG